jgi:hypothetical protein
VDRGPCVVANGVVVKNDGDCEKARQECVVPDDDKRAAATITNSKMVEQSWWWWWFLLIVLFQKKEEGIKSCKKDHVGAVHVNRR